MWERYLSQGRVLFSSRGTTLSVLLPASKHRARSISSFVLGSSCNLSRSRMPATISSTCKGEPENPQSFLLYFLPSSSLSTKSSNSRGLVAFLSVTLFSRQSSGGAKGQTSRAHQRKLVPRPTRENACPQPQHPERRSEVAQETQGPPEGRQKPWTHFSAFPSS